MKLLSVALLAFSAVLQLQNPAGSIEGVVTRLGSGQPVRNARVTVSSRPGAGAPQGVRGAAPRVPIPPVLTDDKGKFVVPGLAAGPYNVQVLANGYVGKATTVTVSGNQSMKDVKVEITPAANIGGRVHDTSDQPLVNMPLELLRYSFDEYGRRSLEPVGTTRTDDRGEYRMYWVTPGRYYLRAGSFSSGGSPRFVRSFMEKSDGASGSAIRSVSGYAFYPSAPDIDSARRIDLQPGADLRSIDVAVIVRPKTFSVRGRLTDSRTGRAPAHANVFAEAQGVGLSLNGPETNVPSPGYQAETGAFEIRDLLPGKYSIVAMVQTPALFGSPGPPVTEASGSITVTVTDSDVNGVSLTAVHGATITGRMRFDGELPLQTTLTNAAVELIRIGGNGSSDERLEPGFFDSDRTFRLESVVPGDYQIVLGGIPLDSNGFIKEARLDGTDVLNTPLRISNSNDKQLDLLLAPGGGEVNGTVNDIRSQPVANALVVLIPDRARFRSDLFRTAFTGEAGRFTFARVAPGDYKVLSWESLEENAWFDPEVLARFELRGHSVHVTESSIETIRVEIIPTERSQ